MKDRILTAVKDNTDARNGLTAAVTRLAEVIPQVTAPPEMSDIEALNDLHETFCDMYDLATRNLEAAREALTEASAAYTAASDEWDRAGAQMDAAARELSAACKAAGVYRTADGLQQDGAR